MISIVVPIYNVEKYLSKCIDSILGQSYKDIEIILVDDGSPDRCPAICDEYAKKDTRLTVIHLANGGVSAARNAGIEAAKGKYIGFVDPDDWIDPEMCTQLVTAIETEHTEIAICGYDYYNENGELDTTRKYSVRPNEIISQKEVLSRFSDMPPTIRHGVVNKLFIRDVLGYLRFPENLNSSEDVVFLSEYCSKIKRAVIVHQPLYKNTIRKGSATHGGLSIKSLADSFMAHEKMYFDVINQYPDLKEHSQAFLLDVCTLKYNEARQRKTDGTNVYISSMKRFILKHAIHAIMNREIYWKTRISYFIL